MHLDDVSDSVSPSTRGGSRRHGAKIVTLTGRSPKGDRIFRMQCKERVSSVAGWSERRGTGEYLLVVILVLSTISLVPIAFDMPDTEDALVLKISALLDVKFDQNFEQNLKPVVGQVKAIEEKLETEVAEIKSRLDKVEGAHKKTQGEPAKVEATPVKTMAQIVKGGTPPKEGADLVLRSKRQLRSRLREQRSGGSTGSALWASTLTAPSPTRSAPRPDLSQPAT